MAHKHVFVIGAGASAEVGLPTGYALKGEIVKSLDFCKDHRVEGRGDASIEQAFHILARRRDEQSIINYVTVANEISQALPLAPSIDSLLHARWDADRFVETGKLAIAQAISEAERKSKLNRDPVRLSISSGSETTGVINKSSDSWYPRFFQLLTGLCRVDELGERLESVALIVFNYDRCVQHFLFHAFRTYYGISREGAAKYVSKIQIIHPYGRLGPLPWESEQGVEFGEELAGDRLIEVSENLRTFTEGGATQESPQRYIHEFLKDADTAVFLGFGFLALNMEMLNPNELDMTKKVACYASMYGMSESNILEATNRIRELFGVTECIEAINASASEFFDHFRMTFERRIQR